jgi:cell division protein FtsL
MPASRRADALFAVVLAVLVLASAVSVVYARHDARQLFIQLQQLTAERDALNIDWGRLQIEHSTWASPGRVEQIARERLGMREPDPASVVIVEP